MVVYFSSEDQLLNAIGRSLIAEVSPTAYVQEIGKMGGNGNLRRDIPKFLEIARNAKIIILTDLDSITCAPELISDWLGRNEKPPFLCLRVAVRTSESWVLADHEGMNALFSNRRGLTSNLPKDADVLDNPKETFLQLTRRFAPREIKDDILPKEGSGSSVGLGYNQQLSSYIMDYWSPERASHRSESLMRARRAIRILLES